MGTDKNPSQLADLLFGRTRAGVLGLLFGTPDEAFYFQQIRRRTAAAGVGAVQREVQILHEAGLIERWERGNQVFYQANRNHPLYPELRQLIAKTVGVFEVLRRALDPMASEISLAFVYGSVARGEERSESDVDLMVIGDVSLEALVEQLAGAERILQRTINPTLYSSPEFRKKLTSGNHFLSAVVKGEKVFLIGTEDELGTIREKRVDRRRA